LFDRQLCGFDGRWRDRLEKSIRDGRLDDGPANVEAVDTTAIDQIFATAA
jgi:hypothetical protein